MSRTPAELVAEARERIPTCSCAGAPRWIEQNPDGRLIDVREPAEHAAGSITDSVHIPRGLLEFQIGEQCDETATPILLFCASGGRAALSAVALGELGYSNVTAVAGSFAELSELLGKQG